MLFEAIVAVAMCAEPSVPAVPAVKADEARPKPQQNDWEFFVALSGGYQPDVNAGAGTGRIGFNRRLNRFFRPELHLFSGGDNGPQANQFFTGIRLGTRIELPRDGAIPFLWIAFAHQHETSFEAAKNNPIPISLGLSEDGVIHRTGLDVGLGVSWDFPKVREGTVASRLGLRASMVSLLGPGAPRTFEGLATFGVLF